MKTLDPLTKRLWDNVLIGDECWEWQSTKHGAGYGYLSHHARHYLTHRLAYESLVGPIPDGLQLDHLCRNRICCNPSHLEPVTRRENILRGDAPSARHAKKTHCPRGHEYSPENTHLVIRPGATMRHCRACGREKHREARMRKRYA